MFSLLRSIRLTTKYYRTYTADFLIHKSASLAVSPKSILEDDDAPIDLSEDYDKANGARPGTAPVHRRAPPSEPTPHEYLKHKQVIAKSFPQGWKPAKKLSRDAMDGLRQMHHHDPLLFTTPVLASKFRISPEAVRRILKSKWEPSSEKRKALVLKNNAARSEWLKLERLRERIEQRQIQNIPKDGRGHARPYGKMRLLEMQEAQYNRRRKQSAVQGTSSNDGFVLQ